MCAKWLSKEAVRLTTFHSSHAHAEHTGVMPVMNVARGCEFTGCLCAAAEIQGEPRGKPRLTPTCLTQRGLHAKDECLLASAPKILAAARLGRSPEAMAEGTGWRGGGERSYMGGTLGQASPVLTFRGEVGLNP